MDAKPDELVIALGSSHVARILEHLHEHALQTDVDFADVVPGISGETCLKVWEWVGHFPLDVISNSAESSRTKPRHLL